MILQIGAEQIPYQVEKTTGKRIRMAFKSDAPVLVIRTPSGQLTRQASAFLQQQEAWILKQYQHQRARHGRREAFLQKISDGQIPFMGTETPLHFQMARAARIQQTDDGILLSMPEAYLASPMHKVGMLKAGLRNLAAATLPLRTQQLATQTGSQINTVRIKDHKSKWGSCSVKRNINLNWHLIFLEEALIDYVIIHELMHLREMNHSARFWQWVATYYPAYKKAESHLKAQEWLIGILD